MKKILSVVSVLVFVMTVFAQGVLAQESQNANEKVSLSKEEKVQLSSNFDDLGINKITQMELIDKIENGETLDSMKEENLQKVANNAGNLNESDSITFEDGSKIVYGNELVNTGLIQPMLASGTYTVKSYWYTGVLNYSFYSDFVIKSGDNNDYIKKSYNPDVSVLVPGGSYSNKEVTIERKYETSSRRAYSRMDFDYSVPYGGTSSVDLYFNVGDNDYETTLSKADGK